MHDNGGNDDAPERRKTVEECGKCHASGPDGPTITGVGDDGVIVFHTRECIDEFMRESDQHQAELKEHEAAVRRGLAAVRAHLRRDRPAPGSEAATYAAVVAELVDAHLVQDMRGRFVVHEQLFDILDRHFPNAAAVDGTPATTGYDTDTGGRPGAVHGPR
ncbi:hypothetical protein ACU686_12105 [Yinghuangia aomiensis]